MHKQGISKVLIPAIFLPLALLGGCKSKKAEPTGPQIVVQKLRTEYLVNPMGIDTPQPRLSWQIDAKRRGMRQGAYQILAASSAKKLTEKDADLWNSGKVSSDQSILVRWDGEALKSRQRVYWKAKVWDSDGRSAEYSEPAWFEMALLNDYDWQARWIGPPPDEVTVDLPPNLQSAEWIWFDEPLGGPNGDTFPSEHRYLLGQLEIPKGAVITRARGLFGINDNAHVFVNGTEVQYIDAKRHPVVDLTEILHPGKNVIAVDAENTGRIAGFLGRIDVDLEDGSRLTLDTNSEWKANNTTAPGWQTGKGAAARWPKARAIASYQGQRFRNKPYLPASAEPTPYLRHAFGLEKPIKAARVYLSGLGYYELYVNGQRVGDSVLDPAFTDYTKTVSYVTHDVTAALQKGDNALGVVLGNGFFNTHTQAAWDFFKAPWRATPRLLLQLHVTHDDGSETVVTSNDEWQRMQGPLRFDGIRNGEIYDARLENPGWSEAGYEAKPDQVKAVALVDAPKGTMQAQMHHPIRVIETVKTQKLTEPKPGVFIFDLGQNISGWVKLSVRGPAGTQIRLRHAERLYEDGTLDNQQIARLINQGDFQTDTYILKGGGQETWTPRFSFHGFRYVEVTGVEGLPDKPTADMIEGQVVHTDFAPIGKFESSHDLLNQIQTVSLWSYRTNFHGLPSDCPHREKMGWMGDGQLALETGLYNYDSVTNYIKWTRDMLNAQWEDGQVSGVAPTGGWGYGKRYSGPAWDSALFLVPWAVYEMTGDKDLLAEVYPAWVLHLDWMEKQVDGLIADWGLPDWLAPNTKVPVPITSTAYYFKEAELAGKAAAILGKADDSARYNKLAADIRKAFRDKFFDAETGKAGSDEQTALSAMLYQGLADEDEYGRITERLIKEIAGYKDHLDSGIHGTKYSLHALADNDQIDVAFKAAIQETFPSWGDIIKKGGTTFWESFSGEGGSHNHAYMSHISHWMYRGLAGIQIDADAPGFEHIIIRPGVPADLEWVKADLQTQRGLVRSRWKQVTGSDGSKAVHYEITIPGNAHATVWLPVGKASNITENDQPVGEVGEIKVGKVEGGRVPLEIGSGAYSFVVSI